MKLELNNSSNLPYFKTYLESRRQQLPTYFGLSAALPGIGIGIALGILSPLTILEAVPICSAVTLVLWNVVAFIHNRVKKQLPPDTILTLEKFGEEDQSKLHKKIDGTALQLLEVGAYYWVQIHTLLESDTWTSSPHFQGLRTDIGAVADQAMDELAGLAAMCMGTGADSRGKDFKRAFDDLADGDIKEALSGFAEAFTANPEKYKFRSPHIGSVFPAAREIAERLKLLASEVATTTVENERQRLQSGAVGSTTLGGMDAVLNSLKATRVAQEELDQDSTLHHHL
ncbi:MAG: hypothetical protein JNJ45_08170 [Chthonomonas sp.]|nr:hypothetical protein [Chthonomonas sp.]